MRDPALIQNILIKDFQYFTDHSVYHDEKNDPLSAHLFAIGGDAWKALRQKLSPAFTTGTRCIFNIFFSPKYFMRLFVIR